MNTIKYGSNSISVVIVTYNRSAALEKCLHSVLAQTERVSEILVLDNASSDDTAEMVSEKFPIVRFVESGANLGCPAGRNLAIGLATGAYALCVDDDGTLEPDAVSVAQCALLAAPHVAVFAGVVLDAYHPGALNAQPGPVFSFSGGICLIQRAAFLKLGGYHEDGLRQGEERELGFRLYAAGQTVVRVPELRLHHHVQESTERRQGILRSSARQIVLTALKYTPSAILIPWIAWKVTVILKEGLRHRALAAVLHGLVDAVGAAQRTWAQRQPASYRATLASTRWYVAPKP